MYHYISKGFIFPTVDYPLGIEKFMAIFDGLTWHIEISLHLAICLFRYLATCNRDWFKKVDKKIVTVQNCNSVFVVIPIITNLCCENVFHYHVDQDEWSGNIDNEWSANISNNSLVFIDDDEPNVTRYFTVVLNWVAIVLMFWCFWRIRKQMMTSHVFISSLPNHGLNTSDTKKIRAIKQIFIINILFLLLSVFLFILQFLDVNSTLITVLFFVYCINSLGDAFVMFYYNSSIVKVLKKWLGNNTVSS